MSFPEESNAGLKAAASDLMQSAGIGSAPIDLTPLAGGANNQVYRIEFSDRAPLVLKRYFSSPDDKRDRFHSEKSFYDIIQASGTPPRTPRSFAWDSTQRLGLFSWIEGQRLLPTEVTRDAVDQALAFYLDLNAHQNVAEAEAAPEASESCFSLEQHFERVERRLARLADIETNSPLNRDALDFVSNQLKPAFETRKQLKLGPRVAAKVLLPPGRRCLSPSDFGFHNALRQADGTLVFFDFEYAGWDDPAKFLCDFLCQPAVPVPQPLWAHCVESICRSVPGGSTRARIALLLPLYHLKWCCIVLNEFLPREQNRRAFSHQLAADNLEEKKRLQLAKARTLFENLRSVDLAQTLGLDDRMAALL
jgi:thiamine kinase-like enzyme